MFATERRSEIPKGWPRRLLTSGLVLLATTVILSAPVAAQLAAQRFKSIRPKMTTKASRSLQVGVANAMRNADPDGQKKIKQYFRTFYFPLMTRQSPADLTMLGRLRKDLFKRYLRPAQVKAAQDFLTNETLVVMRVISRDTYHPAVRYNAVLILGMLDKQYAGTGPDATPPIPLPAATNELLELLEQNEFKGVKVSPQVKVGALEGLERHVRFGIDAQYAERTTQAAMAMLAQEAKTMDVSEEVLGWIKCQAASVLIRQFKDNPNAEVQAALTKLIADSEIGLSDRCHVVGLLKKVNYQAAAAVDVSATMLPLGNLTKAVVDAGSEEATEFIDLVIGKNPGRSSFGGGRRGESGPKLRRSQLLSRLKMITAGAKSLQAGLPDEEQQKLAMLVETLLPVIKSSANKKSLDIAVAEEVVGLGSTVNRIVASWQPASAAVEEVDFAE